MTAGHFKSCSGEGCSCEIKRYWLVAGITLTSLVVEIWGGLVSGSVALLSDAVHVFFDLNGIIIAITVEYYIRFHSNNISYQGKIRSVGGIVSSISLFVMVAIVFKATVQKVVAPEVIKSDMMIVFSIVGLLGNGLSLWIVESGEEDHVTHVALSAHIVSDLIQSVGVVVVAFAIFLTGWQWLDPTSSFVMALWLLRIAVKTLNRSWKSR